MSGAFWSRHRRVGSASSLCETWPAPELRSQRQFATCHVDSPALVLGSTQALEVASAERCAQRGVEIVRRSAGGGAVLVDLQAQVWVDLWVPRDDDLWADDVVTSATWVGRTWAKALDDLGSGPLAVNEGHAVSSDMGRLVCFAGLGPGEVTMGGAKLVGIAQRRTREGARFLTVAPLSWEPSRVVELLDLDGRAEAVAAQLASAATGLVRALGVEGSAASRGALVNRVETAIEVFLP